MPASAGVIKHYGLAEWVDFTRGLLPDAERKEMRGHLGAGCSSCRELAAFCENLSGICQDMNAITVPDEVLRNARALFPRRPHEEPKRWIRIPVELIYDSFLVPSAAGLRAIWETGWQALYRAGNCSLDLRIEPALHSSRVAVIGQLSNHTVPEGRMEGIAVYLKSGRSVIAETRSNRFGEFQMEYEQQARLQLCVYLEDGSQRFEVPLRKCAPEPFCGVSREGAPAAPARRESR